MKALLVLFLIPMMIYPAFAAEFDQIVSTSNGTIDEGTLIHSNGKRVIDIEIDKRYITLSPVSNLIGLAFRLNDPDNLLEANAHIRVLLSETQL